MGQQTFVNLGGNLCSLSQKIHTFLEMANPVHLLVGQFKSPTRGRDTIKALLPLVPDNRGHIGTIDISSAFFQGDSLQREVYIKNPEGSGFWVLNTVLYGLPEGAHNWFDRFHRHCISLGFTTAPRDPAAYSYDRDGA